MTDDASKKAILARRARFVAAALAGISIAACKDGGPFACLKVAAPRDADAEDAQPQVCLSPPPDPNWHPPDPDAGADASDAAPADASSASKDAAPSKDAGQAIKPQPHPTGHPTVCLTPVRPKDKGL